MWLHRYCSTMAEAAVLEKLYQLRSSARLRRDCGRELCEQLRDGVEARLVRTRPQRGFDRTGMDYGITLVHYACQYGWLDFVKSLIHVHKCDARAKTHLKDTSLHYACRHGHFAIVHYLISDQHCDPHAVTLDGVTPLHWACGCGSLDIVRYLISEQHCNPECCDNDQRTPLHWLSGARRPCAREALEFLISIAKCDVSKRDQYGNTALHAACQQKESGKTS